MLSQASSRKAGSHLFAAFSSLCLLAGLTHSALAGDRALIDFIGYSQTGQYFAFTELGIQDGSGFPYANVFVLDVAADSFTGGSPFRVRIDDEAASLAAAHRQALEAARPTLERLDIFSPVDILALSGDAEAGPSDQLDFGLPQALAPTIVGEPQSIALQSYRAPSVEPCADYTDLPIKGFRLFQGERAIHADTSIPQSRGCPLDYALFAVVAPIHAQNTDRAVAIVSVLSLGFEGPDRRFIAIPIGQ